MILYKVMKFTQSPCVIWWVRRDLRLVDNQALTAAISTGLPVLALFIHDPHLWERPAEKRQAFLTAALRSLDVDLHQRGGGLVVMSGDPLDELQRFFVDGQARAIFAEEDYSPYARRRDERVRQALPLTLVVGASVHHPADVVKPDGNPYSVFTPFSKTWKALPFNDSEAVSHPKFVSPIDLENAVLPKLPVLVDFPASEAEARRRLAEFLQNPVYQYAAGRDRLDEDGTSKLSPYLRFGLISVRSAVAAVRQAEARAWDEDSRQGCQTWLNELIWREFYEGILYHHPQVLETAFQPAFRELSWRHAPVELKAWQEGRTGTPVVDACMRQLLQTGWMHNRGRMIVASYLVKDLLIDWREGERWFMRNLVDGDPASNNGGWQWTAGVGTDAAPYFRILNPVSQGIRHDPQGRFVRRWAPELRGVADEFIHQPWLMDESEQKKSGCIIGRDYPAPLVDHAAAKARTLAVYNQARQKWKESMSKQEETQ